ncbi:hypothetical protein CBR_g3386 [Chara braunii]|uniref:Ubiquitin-like protease family profile domain-containing protein n=1 Tax=Chara braunii TaxID=69332 RepID=A0A388JQV0_CHABU|nr:hypothetical protein CBR_g3386 [Chara braunii]|eukprot:GBG60143.1 hypothetical protein CBR_g3386 [Chara braunii]
MTRLSVYHVRTGKWVRHAQRHATFREGNMLVEEYDRLYVVFNGENLADNTVAVFPDSSPTKAPRAHAPSPAKHEAATHSKAVCSSEPSGHVVACFDVADEDKFPRSQWEDGGVTNVRGATYVDRERNPSHLISLLENFCRVGQTVFFFGKAHASIVWELLRNGRNVVALEDEAKMIDYLNEFVKTRVGDPRNNCSFVHTTGERNWDPKRDMYWKLSGNKRTEVWDFLFKPGPPAQTDLEYNRRRNLVFGVLNGYHDAPRESISNFMRRLEHIFFLMAEPLTLENYKAQFDEEDPFDANDMEKLSDSETFGFESMPLPRVVAQVGDEEEGSNGGGDEGDSEGDGGDGSRFVRKGSGKTSPGEKAFGGKGSGGKGSGGKGSARKGSGRKGSGGKGSGRKGGAESVERSSRKVLEGPAAGVLETGGGEYEHHASEGVSVDVESKSTAAPGEEELSPGAHAIQREEETQHWQSRKVLETEGSEHERHTSEGASGEAHALQREEEIQHWPACEVLKGLDSGVLVTETSEEVLHSRSAVATTREGVVKGGQWTFMEARLLGDEEGKEEPVVEARVHGDEKGGEPVVEGSEVAVGIQMDPKQKDHEASPTRCGEEQGDRASLLSTGREMVLHEAMELRSDSADEAVCQYGQKAKLDLPEPKVVVHGVPQQSDESSCGVFMLAFAFFLHVAIRHHFR